MHKSYRTALILTFAALLILSGLFAFKAYAQSFFDYDFAIDDGGWTGISNGIGGDYATYHNPYWISDCANGGLDFNVATIRIDFGSPINVHSVRVYYDFPITNQYFHIILNGSYDSNHTGAATGVSDVTAVFDQTGVTSILIQNNAILGYTGCTSNNVPLTIYRVVVEEIGYATPTPTATFTPTPTLPAPSGSGSNVYSCPLLGNTTANFQSLPGKWALSPTTLGNPSSDSDGLLISNGVATLTIPGMSRFKPYKINVVYHITDDSPGFTEWLVKLGKTFYNRVPVTAVEGGEQFFTILSGMYNPNIVGSGTGADSYTLEIRQSPSGENASLIIDFICVQETSTVGEGGDTHTVTQAGTGNGGWTSGSVGVSPFFVGQRAETGDGLACEIPASSGLLNGNVFTFGVSFFWHCGLRPALQGIWSAGAGVLRFIQVGFNWLSLTWQAFSNWLLAVIPIVINWLRGTFGNVVVYAYNALVAFFNNLGVADIVNNIVRFIGNLPAFFQSVVATASAVIDIVGYWITRFINAIINVTFAVPALFTGIINGFNATASGTPIYAPACNSSNPILVAPCLAFYVMDNTVWDSPAFWIMPIFLGLVAWDTIVWAIAFAGRTLGGK